MWLWGHVALAQQSPSPPPAQPPAGEVPSTFRSDDAPELIQDSQLKATPLDSFKLDEKEWEGLLAPPQGKESEDLAPPAADEPPVLSTAQPRERGVDPASEGEQLVISATKIAQTISESPARMLVVTKDQMRRRGHRHVRDIFADLPGFAASRWSTAEWGTNVLVRGVSGNHRIVFLLDSQRYNPPGGEEVPWFENLPLTFVDRIEVMYGPGSALYGNDAFNGVINVITSPRSGFSSAQAAVDFGLYGKVGGAAMASKRFGDFEIRFGAHATRADSPNLYALYPGEYEYDTKAQGKKIRLDRMESEDLALSGFEAPEIGFDFIAYAGTPKANVRVYHRSYELSSAWDQSAIGAPFVRQARFGDTQQLIQGTILSNFGRLDTTTNLEFSRYQIRPLSRFVTPIDLTTQRFDLQDYRGGQSAATRLEEKLDFHLIPDRLLLTLGGALQNVNVLPSSSFDTPWNPDQNLLEQASLLSFRRYTETGDAPLVDGEGFVYNFNPELFSAPTQLPTLSTFEYQVGGLYGQVIWHVRDWLQLTGGLRWDYSSRFGSSVNPRLVVVASPWATSVGKLIYGRAYLEPTPYQVYGVFATSRQMLFPNPDLSPEVLHSLEAVWEQKLGARIRWVTSAYLNLISNIINDSVWNKQYVYVEIGEDRVQQREQLQSTNSGDARFYGIDSALALKAGWFQGDLSLSWVDGKQQAKNLRGKLEAQEPQGLSKLMTKLGLSIEPLEGLTAELRGSFYSAPFLDFSASQFRYAAASEAFFLLDANLRYALRMPWSQRVLDRLSFFVRGRNLLDARYKLLSGRPGVNPLGSPQPPLTVLAGLEAQLGL